MGSSPLIATALHAGSEIRPGLGRYLALDESARRAARDPFVAGWAGLFASRIVVNRSRFEVDLDLPRERAVPMDLRDEQGRDVWREPPPREIYEDDISLYDRFYDDVSGSLRILHSRFARVLLLDLRCRVVPATASSAIRLYTPPGEDGDDGLAAILAGALADAGGSDALVSISKQPSAGVFLPWVARRFAPGVCTIALQVDAPAARGEVAPAALGQALETALETVIPALDTQLRGLSAREEQEGRR